MDSSTRYFVFPLMVLGLLLAAPACERGNRREEAQAQLAKAEAQYSALVASGVHPRDPAYDAVIAAFEAVPPGTKARHEAEARLAALRALRTPLPPQPLATPGATGPGTDEVDAQRVACEALAKKLGATPVEARGPVLQELAACRERLVRLHAHAHPEPDPGAHEADFPASPAPARVPDAGR
ncbi:hypothetical protein P2318_30370 [Myxococcaceae bacterium GXIMD 01537]